ncbi:MAG: antitoxin VapB family protein [Thermofilum sp.]|uniref:Antitoxin n=1 Tax=Thermofilum pendens TaxID=2269 RepID=A0A7C4H3P9_THEPE
MHHALYVKTITISDEVYYKLVALKGDRSFTEVIDELIRSSVKSRVEMIISLSRRSAPPELEEAVKLVREGFKARFVETAP